LLKQAASDPRRVVETRAQIVGILGDMRALDAIPTLIVLLSDENDALRKAARDSLERITLRSFATVEEWSAWWERSGKMSREEMIEDLVALQAERLRNRETLIEKLYLALLSDRKDRNDPAPLLAALAESESAKVKLYAIKELAPLRSKPVVAALVKALEDQDAGVRQVAADTLAAQGDPAAAPDLLKALKDSSAPVRAAAAKSLGALKVREACPALCDRLSDSSPDVAAAAARALGDLADPAALDPLIKVIGSPTIPAAIYEAAAGALAKIKDPRAAPVLISLLQSPKENVRWTAVDALGGLKAKEAVAPLTSVAQKDGNAQIREAAVAALGNIGDATALGPIVEALSDAEKRVADQALRSLVQLADVDHALYGAALDRLLSAQRYAQAETVLAGAADQLGRTPNSADDIIALRSRTAGGLIAAKEWARARPHLEALLSKAPKEAKYVTDLFACLLALRDYEALLTLLAQARRGIPDQSAGWWQDTVRAVEQMAADGDATRVAGAVDSLEKEAPELGGEASAAKLRDLRAQAQKKQPPAVDPAPPPAP
jgi:HEAT repeat protein